MIALGSSMKSDGFHEELIMSSLLGVSFVGAFLVVGSSFILPYLRRVITPTVSGIVVLMIGLSLIKVGLLILVEDLQPKAAVRSAITNISALVYWF